MSGIGINEQIARAFVVNAGGVQDCLFAAEALTKATAATLRAVEQVKKSIQMETFGDAEGAAAGISELTKTELRNLVTAEAPDMQAIRQKIADFEKVLTYLGGKFADLRKMLNLVSELCQAANREATESQNAATQMSPKIKELGKGLSELQGLYGWFLMDLDEEKKKTEAVSKSA